MNEDMQWLIDQEDVTSYLDVDGLSSITSEKPYFKFIEKGTYLYMEGDPSTHIYFLKKGRVKIGAKNENNKEVTKKVIIENNYFGELGLVGEEVRTSFAYALDNLELAEIPLEVFKKFITNPHELDMKLLEIMNKRRQRAAKKLKSLVFLDSRSRIVDYLVYVTEQYGDRVGYEFVVRRFLTHQDIANLTATSRQTVTTVLNELREKNIITFNRKRLLIRDLELLREESESV